MEKQILDQHVLEQLRVFLGDEVEDLLQEFVNTTPLRLQQFSQAMTSGNSDEACNIVHALKSSSGNLGLIAFSHQCRHIEEQIRSGEAVQQWSDELTRAFEQARTAIHS